MAYGRNILCADCGVAVHATSTTQRYCSACSERRDLQRKRLWASTHPPTEAQCRREIAAAGATIEMARAAGRESNAASAESITWAGETPDLLWMVRVAVPFSYAMSKNAIYRLVPQGHMFLRREARAKRDAITGLIRQALADRNVAHNKVWLDILVQKPNHKGDAVNVVDTVCDAVKRAIPVDDRWFCIRRLDWQIVKDDPQLFIGIGQDSVEDCQVCSFCGLIKAFDAFGRKQASHLGIDRVCKECRRAGRVLAKASSSAAVGGVP